VLVHVLRRDELAAATATGEVRPATFDDLGFVHLCTPAQLAGVIARWFDGVGDLVVLDIEEAALARSVDEGALRWEEGEPGERFPHLYAPLPLGAVVAVRPWATATRSR
jgi:uncharacterized protein (DUF952 family)